jgi:hypothetical protein
VERDQLCAVPWTTVNTHLEKNVLTAARLRILAAIAVVVPVVVVPVEVVPVVVVPAVVVPVVVVPVVKLI